MTQRPAFSLPQQRGSTHCFHAMVKPVGSACNLNCTYCYYLSKADLLHQPRLPRMSDDTLEEHIRQYIEAQNGEEVIFSWQGGEPTLLGLDFFRRVVEFQDRHRRPFQRIENDLQTNGTLLDDDWVDFLKEHRFLVGLSIDGPADLHDRHRITRGGQPTHAKVMDAMRRLRARGVPFNALCVVNRDNARKPREVYRFLADEVRPGVIQFIPCVEPADFRQAAPANWRAEDLPIVNSPRARPGSPDSIVTDWSVDPADWGTFLCETWDAWIKRDYGRVHVDHFESAIAQSLGLPAQKCTTAEFCGKALAIEHNGDAYCCDHFVYDEFRLGNIHDTHWGEMAYSERQERFGYAKRDTLPAYCRECPHLDLCWGECPKNRFVRTPGGKPGLNYLCPGLKRFFAHVRRDMPGIIRRIRQDQRRTT